MPGDDVQVSARISSTERDAIRAHGGLVHLIRKFLADNATEEEERLIGGKKALETQKKELEVQRKALEEQAIKLDVGIVGFTNRIEALASRESKKSESGNQNKRETELRLLKKAPIGAI
jgi:phage shock protein A